MEASAIRPALRAVEPAGSTVRAVDEREARELRREIMESALQWWASEMPRIQRLSESDPLRRFLLRAEGQVRRMAPLYGARRVRPR